MREIKVRAWDQFGTFTDNGRPGWLQDITGLTIFDSVWHSDDFIKVQYTGLKDKNGKEIYEGDIVRGDNRGMFADKIKQTVKYHNGCFMFGTWNAHEYFNRHQNIEAIGNVFENPELLQEGANG